jgi:hypothetical protein
MEINLAFLFLRLWTCFLDFCSRPDEELVGVFVKRKLSFNYWSRLSGDEHLATLTLSSRCPDGRVTTKLLSSWQL